MIELLDSGGNVTQNFYPAYDGNGNVTALIDNAATVVATYHYDAYGNLLSSTGGTTATENPYRFSTKPLDNLTGLYYYGYRFYDPVTGRWLSRDPIGERGGIKLYVFCYNSAFYWGDYLGADPREFDNWNNLSRPIGTVACAGCHGTADGSWSNIAAGDVPANFFQREMPAANPPSLYAGIEFDGFGPVGGGVSVVSCCDEKKIYEL